MFIDSHAHLFFQEYEADLGDVLRRAREAGVTRVVNPGTDLATSEASIRLAAEHTMIHPAVGFHPHDAAKADDDVLAAIERLSHSAGVVAIGEIGLDYHYDFSPRDVQRRVFAAQIEIAVRRDLPIIIHSREAEEDSLRIVDDAVRAHPHWRAGERSARGVFHCFPGDVAMARTVIGWGFYVSLPGPVTFASKPTRPNLMASVAAEIPLEDMLLETDSPYLTPVPFRGQRNEPSHIPLIARKVAELRGVPVEAVAEATTAATRTLFRLPS